MPSPVLVKKLRKLNEDTAANPRSTGMPEMQGPLDAPGQPKDDKDKEPSPLGIRSLRGNLPAVRAKGMPAAPVRGAKQ